MYFRRTLSFLTCYFYVYILVMIFFNLFHKYIYFQKVLNIFKINVENANGKPATGDVDSEM